MSSSLSSFKADIYPITVYLATGFESSSKLSKRVSKRLQTTYELPEVENCSACCFFLDSFVLIAFWEAPSISLIVHEAVHAANYYCKMLGIKTKSDDETLAYLTTWIVENCLKRLKGAFSA